MKHSSKHAFTLTELLVVVPVAALLTTMLFAVSNDAKQQLQAAACLNNMRQWGLGFMLYANDWNDYYPYDGQPFYVCGGANTSAWFNVVPPYIGQKPLCDLYTAGTPPTPLTKSVWSCPSSTNTTAQPTLSNPCFMYAMNLQWHVEGNTRARFRRNQMTSPTNTILFCEEPEDNYPDTCGLYDTTTRHSGGSNFVMGDGHAEWVAWTNFCRSGNTAMGPCPAPLGQIQWNQSGINGAWKSTVHYHWWPFINANVSSD